MQIDDSLRKASRVILRLQAAAIAVDEMLTELLGTNTEDYDEVLLLRAAILEAERYGPSSKEIAEYVINKSN